MGTNAPVWGCPICGQVLAVTPYANPKGKRPGFRLDCYGTDESPHRLIVYLHGYKDGAAFPNTETKSGEASVIQTRAESLLERVSTHLDRKAGPNGKGKSGLVGADAER